MHVGDTSTPHHPLTQVSFPPPTPSPSSPDTRPPLAAPTEVTVTLLPGSLTEALVTWTPPAGSDISGYRIRFVSDQEDDVTINEATDRGTIQGDFFFADGLYLEYTAQVNLLPRCILLH